MKLLKKISIGVGVSLMLATNVVASSYIVKSGDTLLGITYKLGFDSIEQAGFKAPSGDIHKIFPGDVLEYKAKYKKKKSRFKSKEKIDLKKFCFKNNHSIHYRAEERCR
jgi:major membrane immunogen (membrane-anchored lipoprotein)